MKPTKIWPIKSWLPLSTLMYDCHDGETANGCLRRLRKTIKSLAGSIEHIKQVSLCQATPHREQANIFFEILVT